MTKIGIIGGTGFMQRQMFERCDKIETVYGPAYVYSGKFAGKDVAFIARHGKNYNIPAHMINNRANIRALKDLGVTEILSMNSCGSMNKKIKPPAIAIPSDYMSLRGEETFYDGPQIVYTVPGIDERMRKLAIEAAKRSGIKVAADCTYIQTRGPRLETMTEIRFYSKIADIIGMTMASEATLAREADIHYVSICTVDNYAHGVGGKISQVIIERNAQNNTDNAMKLVERIVERL